jgi:hypothetical protein
MSAYKIQMPGNYPEESIQHVDFYSALLHVLTILTDSGLIVVIIK